MNNQSEDHSRLRAAFAQHSERAKPSASCPEAELIWDAAQGEAQPQEVYQIALHTSECAACAEAWRLAAQLPETRSEPYPKRKRLPRPWYNALGLAAAVILAIFIVNKASTPNPDPTLRTGEQHQIVSAIDGQTLPKNQCLLAWSAPDPDQVVTYRILVQNAEFGTILRQEGLTRPQLRVPGKLLDQHQFIIWHVEAVLKDQTIQQSPTFTNRLLGN